MRRYDFIRSAFVLFIIFKCQFFLVFKLFDFLLFVFRLFLLVLKEPLIRLLLIIEDLFAFCLLVCLQLYVCKWMLNNLYLTNDWWIQRFVLLSRVQTLQGHQIVYRIADHFTKDCVFFVQVLARAKRDKKLRFVRIFPCISHCDNSPSHEFKSLMKLVSKGASIDRLASHPRTSWITSLNHKPWNKPVENCINVISI